MNKEEINIERFEDIHSQLAIEAFEVRRTVFIVEQEVEENEEFDEFEKSSVHYAAILQNRVVGTARWRKTKQGIKLERFAVLKEYRRYGVGNKLLVRAIEEVNAFNQKIYLHAQVTAIPFYEKNGFVKIGKEFSECNIRHFEMIYNKQRIENLKLTMNTAIEYVREFHDAFGIGNELQPKAAITENDYQLRHRLMKEENEEYLEAAKNGDLVEIADALGDMLYILCGTILKHGLQHQITEVFEEIQKSNMSKLDQNGNPIYREDGKVMKSDQYFKPDLVKVLKDFL